MTDRLTPEARSRLMSKIGRANTGPERCVRSLLHRLGYRFRLQVASLPGTPDIVLPGRKAVVFVHGCFWHGHVCKTGKMPKSRVSYWVQKIDANRNRDRRQQRLLRKLGWKVILVWECELKDSVKLENKLQLAIPARTKASRDEL